MDASPLLTVAPEVLAALPGMRVVVVLAEEIGAPTGDAVERRWQAAWRRVHDAYGYPNAQSHPHLQAWRAAMKAIGAPPKEFSTSVEALVRRALRTPEPFHVTPLVDFYNAVSLDFVVPAGGYDLEALPGPLALRLTREGDTFQALGAEQIEEVPSGEVAYTCGSDVVTRHLVWRQSRLAAIGPTTRRALFLAEILPAHGELADSISAALAGGLRACFGARTTERVLSAAAPAFVVSSPPAPGGAAGASASGAPLLRRARRADAPALAALAERTFRATFAADNTASDMNHHCARAFSPALQAAEIADPAVVTLVAEESGALVAYAQLHWGAPSHEGAHVVAARPLEVLRFYVDTAQHGRGLAQALMAAVIAVARAGGGDALWLGVWERNPRAIRFYGKLGFVTCGEQTFVLGSDPQRDLVMMLPLDGQ